MLTKAIIQSIDYTKNMCRVRIPLFENASRNVNMIEADAQINIVPGIYTLNVKFGDESCGGGKDGEMIPLMVLYSKEVLVQRWNDVLAVKNSDYNGGNYEFKHGNNLQSKGD